MTERLIDAIKAGDDDRVRALLAADEALANAKHGELPVVMLAAYYGQRAVAQTLIDHGADVDIFAAAALNKADRLALLLRDPGVINSHSHDGWTPLALAAHFGAHASARLLLAAGADLAVRSKNPTGNTPLHAAVAGKRHEIVELLVDAGADVNAQDADGWTSLNLAAHEGIPETVSLLLAHSADPTIPANNGQTPVQTAEREGKTAALEILRQHR
ncbi:MAG TPA: ankyrin repeat domain-containing protein [Thermomicrobiales bacterium]|nr:ankyrin repeat domain-containing protein [Thermomicrobiales bacterium]